MATPISEMITCAARSPIPGIVRRRLICWARGARTCSIRVSSSSIMDVRWSMCSRCIHASSPWCSPKRPEHAMVRSGIFLRITPRARSASTRGSRSPPISASISSRADSVMMLEATASILMPPSSRTLDSRCSSRVLEDGGIKIDSVASSITTLSARDMIEALIGGERDPRVLADLARGVMRKKIPDLTMACSGRFGDHHGLLARMHLEHIDHLTSMIDELDTRIERVLAPLAQQMSLLRTIPGIGERAAQVIISEIGVAMSRFPTAAHLASWAGLCPGNNESAGKHKSGRTRKGNQEVRTILTECAWSAGKTGSYPGAQFRRLHRRFGKKGGGKAAVAVAHTLIVIIWHVLNDLTEYRDLGGDYFTRHDNPEATRRRLIHNLEALGYDVQLTPVA